MRHSCNPGAVRAELRPARTAQRQHACISRNGSWSIGCIEEKPPGLIPSAPAMPRLERCAHCGKAAEPSAQQWRCLHGLRKHAATRSHKRLLAELGAEGAQVVG